MYDDSFKSQNYKCLLLRYILIFLSISAVNCQTYLTYGSSYPPIQTFVTLTDGVLLIDSRQLLVLDNELQLLHSTEYANDDTNIIVASVIYTDRLISLTANGSLFIHYTSNLSILMQYLGLFMPFINIPSIHLGSQDTIIPIYVSQSIIDTNRLDRISEIDLVMLDNDYTLFKGLAIEQPIRFKEQVGIFRQAVKSFSFIGFSFFVVNQKNVLSPIKEVRIVRLCENDTFTMNSDFTSKYELLISCLPTENNELMATYAFLIDSTLIVAFTTGSIDSICEYSLDTINSIMDAKYDKCAAGLGGDAGFVRTNTVPCRKILTGSICDVKGNLRKGLEELTPLQESAVYTAAPMFIRGIAATTYAGFQFLFLGTATGEVHKLILQNDSLTFIYAYSIYPHTPTQLQWNTAVNSINVITNNTVFILPFNTCDIYTDCTSCLSSRDPICGWCTLINMCTPETKCYRANTSLIWSSSSTSNDMCPTIRLENRSRAYSVYAVEQHLELEITNLPARETAFLCDFGLLGNSELKHILNNTYICEFPINFNKKVLNFNLNIQLSLMDATVMERFLQLANQIEFYNCSKQMSCSECANHSEYYNCTWCLYNSQCIDNTHTLDNITSYACNNNNNDNSMDINIMTSTECPILYSTVSPALIHTDVLATLTLTGNKLPIPRTGDSYMCVLEDLSVAAVFINTTHLSCAPVMLRPRISPTVEYTATIRIIWNNYTYIQSNGDLEITVYDCSKIADSCSTCQSTQLQPSLLKYNCAWCQTNSICYYAPACSEGADMKTCPIGSLDSIVPMEGPISGGTKVAIMGTNLGVQFSDVKMVRIGQSNCILNEEYYQPGKIIVCTTQANKVGQYPIEVSISQNQGSNTLVTGLIYTYTRPKIIQIIPTRGPVSGHTRISIKGSKLLVGSQRTVTINGKLCPIQYNFSTDTELICTSPPALHSSSYSLILRVDNYFINFSEASEATQLLTFQYVPDPTVTRIIPSSMFPKGGLNLTIIGTNFGVIQSAKFIIYPPNTNTISKRSTTNKFLETTCKIIDETTMKCPTPEIINNNNNNAINNNSNNNLQIAKGVPLVFNIILDAVPSPLLNNDTVFRLYPNPVFYAFIDNKTQHIDQPILIQGKYFKLNGLDTSHIIVHIGKYRCNVDSIQENLIICYAPYNIAAREQLLVKIQVGNIHQELGNITIIVTELLQLLTIVLPAVILTLCITLILLSVFCLCLYARQIRKKKSTMLRLINYVEKKELDVAQESKIGFTELQTGIQDFEQDLSSGMPFLDIRTYILSILFPSKKHHVILQELQPYLISNHEFVQGLDGFKSLVLSEPFLMVFITTVERQERFTLNDRCNFASLLMVCLLTRMEYITIILKNLLHELANRHVTKHHPKLFLRRTDSVAEKLLTNWLTVCLYTHIQDRIGTPLYRLYRALKMQIEKGPVDVVTGDARYSLSEAKLLRHVMEVQQLNCYVSYATIVDMPILLLDCDSISQAKEKCLDMLFKGEPIPERPALIDLDLDYTKSRFGLHYQTLRDRDASSESEKYYKRINTLSHYNIESGGHFQIIRRQRTSKSDYLGSLFVVHEQNFSSSTNEFFWHLSKSKDLESVPSKDVLQIDKIVSEVYLHRLLYTKNVLQNFVDDLFTSIWDDTCLPTGQNTTPIAIRYLFNMLDNAAANCHLNITDNETIQTWKNNSLALRFWVNLIKNPEFVFSIHKSSTMDSCLLVIAQTFMDSCSVSQNKLNKDSPTSKLLYAKDVNNYKTKVLRYYDSIQQQPKVEENEMRSEMENISEDFKKKDLFVEHSAYYELFRYAHEYYQPIYDALIGKELYDLANNFKHIYFQLSKDERNDKNSLSINNILLETNF